MFRSTNANKLDHYNQVGHHAELVAQSCSFLLEREEWKHAAGGFDEVKQAQMSTVETVWSSFVRDQQALVNANMKEIGWFNDMEHVDRVDRVGLFGIVNKKQRLTQPAVFRRWRMWCRKEKSIRQQNSHHGKKKMFLEHCLKIYRLVRKT